MATIRENLFVLGPALAPYLDDMVLERHSQKIAAKGLFTQTSGAGSSVALYANTGELGTQEPLPGDYLTFEDTRMLVVSVGGFDKVAWNVVCGPALNKVARSAAPTMQASIRGNQVAIRLSAIPASIGATQFRYHIRPANSVYFRRQFYTTSRSTTFRGLPVGIWYAGAVGIKADGTLTETAEQLVEII